MSDLGRPYGKVLESSAGKQGKSSTNRVIYGLYQLSRPCCITIDPNSSVSRSNSDIFTCKFKLIAFLGISSDPLRASMRVWLRETRLQRGAYVAIYCKHNYIEKEIQPCDAYNRSTPCWPLPEKTGWFTRLSVRLEQPKDVSAILLATR